MQLLQNGKQQFIDQNGLPLANGTVGYYAPGTLNPQATYQDMAGTIQNTNPITLDSRGQAIIWGTGTYRQIVKDASGVTIWDQIVDTPAGAASLSNTTGAGGAAMIGFDGTDLATYIKQKNARIVTSIAGLRGVSNARYNFCFVTGYYASGDGGGGMYYYDSSDTTSVDDGGAIIVASDNGRWKLCAVDVISVRQYGAKGDNSTDDTAAFQNCLNYATGTLKSSTQTGVKMRIPGGRYVISSAGLTATFRKTNSIIDDGDMRRLTIEGDGQANTYLIYKGPSTGYAFDIEGYVSGVNTGGAQLYIKLQGFRLWRDFGSPRVGGGLQFVNVAYVEMDDMSIGLFNVNVNCSDTLLVAMTATQILGGNGGLLAAKAANFQPNVFKFTRCGITGNLVYGVQCTSAANWSFDTCNFEGNGNDQVNSNTVNIVGGPGDSGSGINFHNCYFEGNKVLADINVGFNSSNSGTINIQACGFNRVDVSSYAKIHINLSCTSTGKMIANISGNAFKSFNSYVPSSSNPVTVIQTSGVTVSEALPNFYQNSVEKPNYNGFPVYGDAYGKLFMTARVIGVGGTPGIQLGWNAATLTKVSTGVYRINYKNPLVVSALTISDVTIVGNDGWGYISNEDAGYLEITTKNASGVATDQNFNVICYAQG